MPSPLSSLSREALRRAPEPESHKKVGQSRGAVKAHDRSAHFRPHRGCRKREVENRLAGLPPGVTSSKKNCPFAEPSPTVQWSEPQTGQRAGVSAEIPCRSERINGRP